MPTKKSEPKDIEVLFLEVGKPAAKKTIKNDLAGCRQLLGGGNVTIQVAAISHNLLLAFDEDGKSKNLQQNLDIRHDILRGNIVMLRKDRFGNWRSVTKKDIDLYMKVWEPRRFLDGRLAASEKSTIERWFEDGKTWVGIFENKDLSHPDIGRRIAVPYVMGDFDAAIIGETRASDFIRRYGMIPWQYVLVEKCKTADEVINALQKEARPPDGHQHH